MPFSFQWINEFDLRVAFFLLWRKRGHRPLFQDGNCRVWSSVGLEPWIRRTVQASPPEQRGPAFERVETWLNSVIATALAQFATLDRESTALFIQPLSVRFPGESEDSIHPCVLLYTNGRVLLATAEEFPLSEECLVETVLYQTEIKHWCELKAVQEKPGK